jgi:hypothetical protein
MLIVKIRPVSLLLNGYSGFFPWVKQPVTLKMNGAIILPPPYAIVVFTGTALPFNCKIRGL